MHTAQEHREWVAAMTQSEIDHVHEEWREWRGESERDAAVRDTSAVVENQSRK